MDTLVSFYYVKKGWLVWTIKSVREITCVRHVAVKNTVMVELKIIKKRIRIMQRKIKERGRKNEW